MKKAFALLIAVVLLASASAALAELTLEDIMGEVDGAVYRNEYLGVGFTLPDESNWAYLSNEEILEAMNMAKSVLQGDLQTILEENQNINVMSASSRIGYPNITIQILYVGETASLYQAVGLKTLLATQVDAMTQSFESSGMQNVRISVDEATIKGKTEAVMYMDYSFFSIPISTAQIVYVKGDYLVYVAATNSGASAEDVLNNIFWID